MNRRKAIELTEAERHRCLEDARTIILVSVGRDGYPHAVPMWFVFDDDGCCYMTTYARAQKTVNVRRNPKVALLVESGERYHELQGVLVRGTAEVVEDLDLSVRVLTKIQTKHLGPLGPEVGEILRTQARKRVVVKVTPERFASWDHRKLGGVY